LNHIFLIINQGLADEACYQCNEVGDTTQLLVCDKCNFRTCHLKCMDPPLDFIPAENWYCKFCIQKYEYLYNDLTNATPLIFPEDFREVYKPETRRRANQRNWTRVATREARTPYNPLDGLFERIEEYRELNTRSRADRLQARLGRIDEEKENEQSVHYHGGKKDKRIKYKTKDNDKFEE
jgi:PHD-finger